MKSELKKFFGVLALSLLGTPGTSLAVPLTTMPTTMVVLGDSLSDVGNLLIATSAATPPNPLPQPTDYFQGRFSNGPIYAEYLWTNLGLTGDLSPSLAGGTNFAVGGARSRYHRFDQTDPNFNPVGGVSSFFELSLLGQRDALLSSTAGRLDPGALYTVWAGSNDVGDAIALAAAANDPSAALPFIAQSAGDLLAVIESLVSAGAQDLLIPNAPNFGLVPEILQLGSAPAQQLATQLSLAFNDIVNAGLPAIGANANIIGFDTFQFLTDLVADPALFGLPADVNTTDPCFTGFVGLPGEVCDDPGNRIFWDINHPSALAHQVLGAAVTRATTAFVPEASTIMLIVLALAALGLQRRQGGIAYQFLR